MTPPETTSERNDAEPVSLMGRFRQFAQKYKSGIGLSILIFYVLLLGLGAIGEIWEIDWILDLPLFRPPGRTP